METENSTRRQLTLGVTASLAAAALLAVGAWLWTSTFPSDEPATAGQLDDRFDTVETKLDEVIEGQVNAGGSSDELVEPPSAAAVAIDVFTRPRGGDADDWDTMIDAEPGDQLEHLVRFKNTGETVLEDVAIGFNLPAYVAALPESTWLRNETHPDGVRLNSDNITGGGIDVGDYEPGGIGYVVFAVEVNPIEAYDRCGTYGLRGVGIVRPAGMNQHLNTTDVAVEVPC